MDPQTEMILRMISDVRQHVTDENNETRRQLNEGIKMITARQDIANGRTNRLEQDVSRLDERTESMVCGEHGARFAAFEQRLHAIELVPLADGTTVQSAAASRGRKVATAAVSTVGGLAVVWAVVDLAKQVITLLAK